MSCKHILNYVHTPGETAGRSAVCVSFGCNWLYPLIQKRGSSSLWAVVEVY